jgi:hemoglobin-like flavoprotein
LSRCLQTAFQTTFTYKSHPTLALRCISLFTECPEAKLLFGFPLDVDPNSDEVLKSKRFAAHAKHLIQMIDSALNMLGPDAEMLREIMMELGTKHIQYGVTPNMFPIMGRSLIEMLKQCLAENRSEFNFSQTITDSWIETYNVLTDNMLEVYMNK